LDAQFWNDHAPLTNWLPSGRRANEKHTGYLKSGYDDADDVAGRAHVLIVPSDTFQALLTADYFHQGGVGRGQIPIPQPGDSWLNDPWSCLRPL